MASPGQDIAAALEAEAAAALEAETAAAAKFAETKAKAAARRASGKAPRFNRFSFFPFLLTELRLMIWTFALERVRTQVVDIAQRPYSRPALLGMNHEARSAALKRGHWATEFRNIPAGQTSYPEITFHFWEFFDQDRVDTVYVSPKSEFIYLEYFARRIDHVFMDPLTFWRLVKPDSRAARGPFWLPYDWTNGTPTQWKINRLVTVAGRIEWYGFPDSAVVKVLAPVDGIADDVVTLTIGNPLVPALLAALWEDQGRTYKPDTIETRKSCAALRRIDRVPPYYEVPPFKFADEFGIKAEFPDNSDDDDRVDYETWYSQDVLLRSRTAAAMLHLEEKMCYRSTIKRRIRKSIFTDLGGASRTKSVRVTNTLGIVCVKGMANRVVQFLRPRPSE